MPADIHPFANYLLSKRSVDDRALNPRLWTAFLTYLDARAQELSRGVPLHLLELGCGIGTMFERIVPHIQPCSLLYTALDADRQNLAVAAARLEEWATSAGYHSAPPPNELIQTTTTTTAFLAFQHAAGHSLGIHFIQADAYAVGDLLQHSSPPVDGLLAHAFMDLVECRPLLTSLHPILTPRAHLYCTINFDGMTVFEPAIDPVLDQQIEDAYHATMDTRTVDGRPAGHSRTGRRLFHDLRASGYDVLDIGSSDWTVFPQPNGYANEEAAFLHHILDFVEGALTGHASLSTDALHNWIAIRRSQIEANELFYMAHQLDYLAQPRSR